MIRRRSSNAVWSLAFIILAAAGTVAAVGAHSINRQWTKGAFQMPELRQQGRVRAPELAGGRSWLNTDKPLSLAALKGKPILIASASRNNYWQFLRAKYGYTDDQIRESNERNNARDFSIVFKDVYPVNLPKCPPLPEINGQ